MSAAAAFAKLDAVRADTVIQTIVTSRLAFWKGSKTADDGWLRLEEPAHCQDKAAEQNVAAPRRWAARRRPPCRLLPLLLPPADACQSSASGCARASRGWRPRARQ